jgi:hypothetical protein
MVDACPECKGTGKAVTKNAADVVSLL